MVGVPRTLVLSSELSALPRMAEAVQECGAAIGAPPADTHALELALEEIVTNVIRHGHHGRPDRSLSLRLEAPAADRIRAEVTDDAAAYNPLARAAVDTNQPAGERPVGGLGVHLVRRIMHVCMYERRGDRNVFTLERALRRAVGAPVALNLAVSRVGLSALIAPAGRLDGLSSPDMERQVRLLIASGVRSVDLDLAGLDYVSSAGLRVFLRVARELKAIGGVARFAALSRAADEVIRVAGLRDLLDIIPSDVATPRG
ncbi:MAG: ATP-binding protein [Verrucomicrobiae bacterium]|nr:ATP-binding protein [Verrucomicrobiae bacterium]